MRVVAFSDTHGQHDALEMPDGDLLIFAGDMCRFGSLDEVRFFNAYLASLLHQHMTVQMLSFYNSLLLNKRLGKDACHLFVF